MAKQKDVVEREEAGGRGKAVERRGSGAETGIENSQSALALLRFDRTTCPGDPGERLL